jgi:tetratricopeptide (TPR) repeat protein
LHGVRGVGNLAHMKRWPLAVGAVVIVAALAWLALRERMSPQPAAPVAQAPIRPAFHASKPLNVVVAANDASARSETEWLERELRYVLTRGRMRIAPALASSSEVFTLHIDPGQPEQALAKLSLIAADGYVEREKQVDLSGAQSRLETVRRLAQVLPDLLGATHNTIDWSELVGIQDAASYDAYLRSSADLFGSSGRGFTQAPPARAQNVDRLESLTRRQPQFARAWSALALSYLSLGGEDSASLVDLAESSAERALALEPGLADAQGALGLIGLHRNEWALAKEQFDGALVIDPNSVAALEGLACLLVDVGHHRSALPFANRAVALQPRNAGAQECLVYAQFALGSPPEAEPGAQAFAAARVRALIALLSKDVGSARRLLRNSQDAQGSSWVDPLLRAVENRREVPAALQEITRAANEREIDAVTEIVSGAALRQSDFVFNRMLRLHRKDEAVPLRLLWLEQTAFLRRHAQFQSIVSATGVPTFWQDEGAPDLCAKEPTMHGCAVKKAN